MVTNLNSKKELTSRNSKKKRIDDKIEDRSNVENLGDRLAWKSRKSISITWLEEERESTIR